MGQAMSFGLTQYDVEDLIRYSKNCFSQGEIEALYQRFRSLDRGHKGYISAEEFMNIPELSINPLAQRLERIFESVNFKEFVYLLSAFSSRASVDDKVHLIFTVYDSDGDGLVSADDMELMLRQLAGSALRDEELRALINRALQQAGAEAGLTREQFSDALTNTDLGAMSVSIDASMY
ncbi:hypothetical protein ABBQ38_010589 [Trebouxia sp. C0009 RCD-2024]